MRSAPTRSSSRSDCRQRAILRVKARLDQLRLQLLHRRREYQHLLRLYERCATKANPDGALLRDEF